MRAYVDSNLRTFKLLCAVMVACTIAGCWEEVHYKPTAADSAASHRAEPSPDAASPQTESPAELPSPSLAQSPSDENTDQTDSDFAEEMAAKLASNSPASVKPAADNTTLPNSAAEANGSNSTQLPWETPAANTPKDEGSIKVTHRQETNVAATPVDDAPPTVPPSTAATTPSPAPAPTSATPPQPEGDSAHSSRRIAWLLGNKLSLSALANDRGGAEDETAKLFGQAQTLAEMLDVKVGDLPPIRTPAPAIANFDRALQYLFAQGQPIGRALAAKFGDDHAALFELAVKSNILLALYRPHASVAGALSSAIEQAGGRSGLPVKLWQPLMDAMANNAPVDDVRKAVYRMHADVDRFLASPAAAGPGTAAQSP
jgi:hypothetical protein